MQCEGKSNKNVNKKTPQMTAKSDFTRMIKVLYFKLFCLRTVSSHIPIPKFFEIVLQHQHSHRHPVYYDENGPICWIRKSNAALCPNRIFFPGALWISKSLSIGMRCSVLKVRNVTE